MRAIYNTLPFHKIPAQLVVEMAKACVFWLNSLPPQSNFGNELSPRTIVTGQRLDFKQHCHFQFGEYVQTHEQHNNSMMSRTMGALALCPTGNTQGGFYFLSLSTGRVLNQLRAMALPMPDNVVDQVHWMAQQQKANPGLLFGNRSVGTVNDEAMDDSSDDDKDDEYAPKDEHADGGQDAEDEDIPHDYNYEDMGSIASEHIEHADDDATDMGNMNTNTNVDVNSGQSYGGNEAGTPKILDVEHVEERDDSHVESEGVDEPNNDITHQEADDVEHVEERGDTNQLTTKVWAP